jgi:hypothetical protein
VIKNILISLLVLLVVQFCFADETSSKNLFFNGHNLSITSYVLAEKRCAVGLDLVACGLPGDFSIGSSTWMWTDYGMFSLALRKRFELDYLTAYQMTYFETKGSEESFNDSGYKMQALWNQFVKTFDFEDHYKMHLNLHVNYYFDETLPFSLRRPSFSTSPWQFNLTTLHELHMTGSLYMIGEAGFLDVGRSPQHIHGGASVGVITDRYSVRFGFSMSGSVDAYFSPTGRKDYQQRLRGVGDYNKKEALDSSSINYDYGIHPEFSAFYVF